jgi:hypothetical protein
MLKKKRKLGGELPGSKTTVKFIVNFLFINSLNFNYYGAYEMQNDYQA